MSQVSSLLLSLATYDVYRSVCFQSYDDDVQSIFSTEDTLPFLTSMSYCLLSVLISHGNLKLNRSKTELIFPLHRAFSPNGTISPYDS